VTTRIIRATRRHRYAKIEARAIEDVRLSWAARGLLVYVLARPDDWRVMTKHLAKQGNLRRDGIYGLLKELRTFGYVRFIRTRNKHGCFDGGDYYVREILDDPYPRPALPDPDEPDPPRPGPPKPEDLLSTDVYLGTTTTTTTDVNCGGSRAAEKNKHTLIYPDTILTSELAIAEQLIETLPEAQKQPVLDEWTGIINAGAIKSSTIGCLRALVGRAIDGRFTAERGLRIRETRKFQEHLDVVLQKEPDLPPPNENDINVRRLREIQARAAKKD
jgi:hypothetical protein